MHLNFDFSTEQILWTATFAAQLVLLVVLLGRDRASRYPLFTTAISLATLNLLAAKLLFGKLPQLELSAIFIVLADISAIVSLLVLLELARRTFAGAARTGWMISIVVLLAIGGVVLRTWGPWPGDWHTVVPNSRIGLLGLLQLVAQKLGVLDDVLTIGTALLIVILGSRFAAGFRSHTQQIAIGLATVSISQVAVQLIWQRITATATPHTMAEYQHILGLKDKLINTNSSVYVAALIWWIACLWFNEPGSAAALPEPATVDGASPVEAAADAAAEPAPDAAGDEPRA